MSPPAPPISSLASIRLLPFSVSLVIVITPTSGATVPLLKTCLWLSSLKGNPDSQLSPWETFALAFSQPRFPSLSYYSLLDLPWTHYVDSYLSTFALAVVSALDAPSSVDICRTVSLILFKSPHLFKSDVISSDHDNSIYLRTHTSMMKNTLQRLNDFLESCHHRIVLMVLPYTRMKEPRFYKVLWSAPAQIGVQVLFFVVHAPWPSLELSDKFGLKSN